MNHLRQVTFLLAIILAWLLVGCFPNNQVTLLQKETFQADTIKSPSKVYLFDASVVLFPRGFFVKHDTIRGTGSRYWITHSDSALLKVGIPMDSVAAITYYESKISEGRGLASFLLGFFGSAMTPLSIYCIACPKCCFGSCPTIYTFDAGSRNLEAELFSHSVSKILEEEDLDLLSAKPSKDGIYDLRLTNEALETHFVNRLSVLAVTHPVGTRVYPSNKGNFLLVKKLSTPTSAVNSWGKDILPLLLMQDEQVYRSDESMVMRLAEGPHLDWLQVKVKIPSGSTNARMILRLRNTLLSTVLFYEVVLASQGLQALEWTERMNKDEFYASQFRAVYKTFSGIAVEVFRNGRWEPQGSIGDVGPIAWKHVGMDIPLVNEEELWLRLKFVPDNFMIDHLAFDFDSRAEEKLTVKEIPPVEIRDYTGELMNELLPVLAEDDDQYLITNPGESYTFRYQVPESSDREVSLFVRSKGYYTEWIRGSWLKSKPGAYRFDIFDTDRALAELARSWAENRELIERTFFQTRIPLKEAP